MTLKILDVDLLAFERGGEVDRKSVVEGVERSLAMGFVTSTHDLPSDLLDEAYGLLADFFHLPMDVKRQFHRPEAHGQTGYTELLVETAAGEEKADWKEMLNWSTPLPDDHPLKRRYPLFYPNGVMPEEAVPGITAVLGRFHAVMADVQRRFLRVVALALGAAETLFEEMVLDGPTLTRALHYPPMVEAPKGGHCWAAPHADINLITVLPRSTGAGLEVAMDGTWQPLAPPDNQVIINTGLMLERLSNGRFPSGWHRVVSPAETDAERFSVVQFCHPTPTTILAPLACCCQGATPQRFAAVSAADALEDVLYRIKLLKPHNTEKA